MRRTSGAIVPLPVFQRPARALYVDLDNRCATPPAFAPTRDVDSTSVWYVDAPAASAHASSRHPRAPNSLTSPTSPT